MADDKVKPKHSKNDIIIKDQDGTYKILRDGEFVPLDEIEAQEHHLQQSGKGANKQASKPNKPEKAPGLSAEQMKEAAMQPKKSLHEIQGLANEDLQKRAQKAIRESGVTFASGEVQNRVVKGLVAHFKGVRKPFETKQSLMKPPAEGGAGLEEAEAKRILQAAGAKEEMPPKPKIEVQPKESIPKVEQQKPVMPVGKDLHKPSPVAMKSPKPPQQIVPKPEIKEVKVPKPQVVDVQQPKAPTVGLAGELSYSLADWRRVSVNPQDRIKKIENQLGVLEEESYPQRLQGLAAWRGSEVVKLYLDAGKQSLEQGKPVAEILGQGGPSQLTLDEWQAISELNALIRY